MPSPALRVREGAPEVRWVYVRVHQRTRAHPARAPAGFFLRAFAAPYGAPFGRHPAAEATARSSCSFGKFARNW